MERKNPKVSYMIRVIAGAYVAYLAFKIVQGTLAGDASMSVPLAVFLAVVLGGGGIAVAINGLMGLKRLKAEEVPEEAVEETVEEEVAAAPASGIMQRAAMPAHLRVDEEDTEE